MMAAFTVARSSCGLFHGLRASLGSLALPKHAAVPHTTLLRQCRGYSVSHMSVKERIDQKRKAALVGGGQHRIDAQHKRVTGAAHSKSALFKVNFMLSAYVHMPHVLHIWFMCNTWGMCRCAHMRYVQMFTHGVCADVHMPHMCNLV